MLSFSLLLALGTFAGLGWVALQPPRPAALLHVTAGVWALLGGLAGGRALYAAVHWSYYQAQLLEVPMVWLGGLSGPGALLGGLTGLSISVLLSGRRAAMRRFAHQADALLPLLAALAAAAWLGCWQAGVAYGSAFDVAGVRSSSSPGPADPAGYDPTAHPWYALHSPDEWGRSLPRLPLQPAAALLSIVAVWLSEAVSRRLLTRLADRRAPGFYQHAGQYHTVTEIPGLRAALGLFFLALAWLPVPLLRSDPLPVWQDQPLDLWFYLALVGLSGLAAGGMLLVGSTTKSRKFLESQKHTASRER